MFESLLRWAEEGRLPDNLVSIGIRSLIDGILRSLYESSGRESSVEIERDATRQFLAACDEGPVAAVPDRANEQHYEVPAAFFKHALGPRLKYSCCHWGPGVDLLAEAEESALRVSCERAQLRDGQQVLELGCGWGSLTLWMAEQFPQSQITAVSNSNGQREFIEQRARSRSLSNVHVITADMNDFDHTDARPLIGRFDRVVSIEMFEHMRNQGELLRRISTWLKPDGKLFLHIFCHRSLPYFFEETGPSDWMTRHFFAGGMMPSDSLLLYHQRHLRLLDHWRWNGAHYEQTSNAWLASTDTHWCEIEPHFTDVYGDAATLWRQRWRMFFMACAELFGTNGGNEWFVSHYLFENRS